MPPATSTAAATGNGAPGPVDLAGNPLRLLMVHAHPDDETTTTGATAVRYAAEGVGIHLVTCTRGERGEILDDELAARFAGLAPDDAAVRLGEHRIGELATACARLGIRDPRFLAGPGRWWDSGMAGTSTASHPRAFSGGDLAGQAGLLAAVVQELRPQVVVTYNERGGYGHPDHVRAHEVTMAAVRPTAVGGHADGAWRVSKVYACVVPRSQMERAVAILTSSDIEGPNPVDEVASTDDAPFAVPDELVAAHIDARAWLGAKADAMRAHRSQMSVNGWFFALIERGGFGSEYYQLMEGSASPPPGERWEDDLFAGLRPARMPSAPGPR